MAALAGSADAAHGFAERIATGGLLALRDRDRIAEGLGAFDELGVVANRQEGRFQFLAHALQKFQPMRDVLYRAGVLLAHPAQRTHLLPHHRHHGIVIGRALLQRGDGGNGAQCANEQTDEDQNDGTHGSTPWDDLGAGILPARVSSAPAFLARSARHMADTIAPSDQHARFSGIDRLYGAGTVAKLARCRVAVIGVGGVGSWAAEALARSGVGHIALIDADDICVSNTNRQLPALDGHFGQLKVEAMAARLAAINPALSLDPVARFLTRDTLEPLLLRDYDVVLDACDSFRVKVEAIAFLRRRKIPLVTVGSAGGRTDPTKIVVRDLSRTEHDAMFALIRRKLRGEFHFPKNPQRYFGVSAVYSLENVRYPQADGSVCGTRPQLGPDGALKLDCGAGLGAATHVTGGFAFAAVGKMLELMLREKMN